MSWNEKQRIDLQINRLFQQAGSIKDGELESDLARYICILASGYLEVSCRDIFGKFAENQSSPAVYRFVSQRLDQYQNMNTEKVLQLADSFIPNCRRKIEEQEDFGELKDSVDSIVSNRNNLVHGKDTGISLASIKSYYEKAKRFLTLIERSLTTTTTG